MKRILLVGLLATISCSKPESKYIVKLYGDEIDYTGRMVQFDKTDTVKAKDDIAGYFEAVKDFTSHQIADSILKYRVSKTRSFEVYDINHNNLKIKLPLKQTDSVDKLVRKLKARN